jgi:hypothetical protein
MSDPIYTYFNISDEEIQKTHKDFATTNACTATEDNYFVKKGLYFSDYDETVKDDISKGIAATASEGHSILEIKFASDAAYNNAFGALFDDGQIYSILSQARKNTSVNISANAVSYIQKDTFHIIEIVFMLN